MIFISKKKNGGKKSKRNIKMTRKFRRTRRKRGRGGPGAASSKTPEQICNENKAKLEKLNNFNFGAEIEKIKAAKDEYDSIDAKIKNFDGDDSSTWSGGRKKKSGGGTWSPEANQAHKTLQEDRENAKKNYDRIISSVKSSLSNMGVTSKFYGLEDKDMVEQKIPEAKARLENLIKNCPPSSGGKKSRRKRRKSKKRKSRKRKKRSRRRKRKKR